MEVTRKSRIQLRIQNILFVVLFGAVIGLLGWLSTQYEYEADWTASGRNTLAQPSRQLLQRLGGPIRVTVFARRHSVTRERVIDLLGRYQRERSDFDVTLVDPEREPERVRQLGITVNGESVIHYQGRSEHVQNPTEQTVTNALLRLAQAGDRSIVFLTGHGERAPDGRANHDLGDFAGELERKGFSLDTVNLARGNTLPEAAAALVIAGPEVALVPGEVTQIRDWLDAGGNLLWLIDPGGLHGLGPVAETLGIEFLPGLVVDPNSQGFGIADPSFVLVPSDPDAPIPRRYNTLFPRAVALRAQAAEPWRADPFVTTLPQAWAETGPLEGSVAYDPESDDVSGPLTLGETLTRPAAAPGDTGSGDAPPASDAREQRIAVVGDGDFLSNAFLGYGGNLDLGLAIMRWLTHNEAFIDIPATTAPDRGLSLSRSATRLMGFGFLLGLPALLLVLGIGIWWRRSRR